MRVSPEACAYAVQEPLDGEEDVPDDVCDRRARHQRQGQIRLALAIVRPRLLVDDLGLADIAELQGRPF
jgi:hypothetical protein